MPFRSRCTLQVEVEGNDNGQLNATKLIMTASMMPRTIKVAPVSQNKLGDTAHMSENENKVNKKSEVEFRRFLDLFHLFLT